MENRPYLYYWGKARPRDDASLHYHLLAYHCLDVAAVGKVLLERHTPLRVQIELAFKRNAGFVLVSLPFFLALHDIGKFADSFQNLRPDLLENLQGRKSGRPYTLRHDVLGRLLWDERLDQEINRLTSWPEGEWRRFWINAVTGHHGAPPNPAGLLSDHFAPSDIEASFDFVREIAKWLLADPPPPPDPDKLSKSATRASWLLSGLAVLCDWVGSEDVRWFPYEDRPCSLGDYWPCALEKAGRAVQESGVLPAASSAFTAFAGLFPKIAEPSPLQRYVERTSLGDGPQMFILEDITGSGKTEAALVLAHRLMAQGLADGVYMALPTMATANQMYRRLGECYRRLFTENANPSLMLAHSARDLHEGFRASVFLASQARDQAYQASEETASQHCTAWLADHRKASLFADIGVGTIDQALLSVLHVKHHTLRLLGLSRKVLVVDEVHACDTYMAELLTRLLEFHAALGGSAILLSATLPLAMRRKFVEAFATGARGAAPKVSGCGSPLRRKGPETVMPRPNKDDYPLATHLAGSRLEETPVEARQFVSRRVGVRLLHTQEEMTRHLIEIANSGRCVCWLRNSVKDALDAYAELKPRLGERVSLFHARFALCDRLAIEDANANRFDEKSRAEHRRGRVLIATQVVEQSLDWDFDEMITDLAPMDLLIQRAGRIKRHPRDEHGNPLPQGEQDRRGGPVLHILSPEAVDNPPADWVVKPMRNTALVYPHHGELWLTVRELVRRGAWKMPEDARDLIESVFGEEASYPEELQKSADQVEGQDSAALSLARSNLVSLDYGYDWDRTWYDDVYTPTRLGEPTVTVYLAKHIGEDIVPWAQAHDHAWARSAVNVARRTIAQEIDPDAVTAVKEQLPSKGRGTVLLILEHNADGLWRGKALDDKNRLRRWRYDNTNGLEEEKENT